MFRVPSVGRVTVEIGPVMRRELSHWSNPDDVACYPAHRVTVNGTVAIQGADWAVHDDGRKINSVDSALHLVWWAGNDTGDLALSEWANTRIAVRNAVLAASNCDPRDPRYPRDLRQVVRGVKRARMTVPVVLRAQRAWKGTTFEFALRIARRTSVLRARVVSPNGDPIGEWTRWGGWENNPDDDQHDQIVRGVALACAYTGLSEQDWHEHEE